MTVYSDTFLLSQHCHCKRGFPVVGDEGLGEGLPDAVDLAGVSAALDPDADVDVGEAVLAQEKDRLLQLVLQGSGLHQLQWPAVDLRQNI